jgi:hypothetical protein
LSITSATARLAAATVDEAQHAAIDRQNLAQRCDRAVELFHEHVLLGPAGDADRVEIGDPLALWFKPSDCRLQQSALLCVLGCILGRLFGRFLRRVVTRTLRPRL